MKPQASIREQFKWAQRIVVKVGTLSLVDRSGRPQPARLKNLVDQLATAQSQGKEVVLVTSGAIGAGMQALGIKTRPRELAELQMCAAVGQSRLMEMYSTLFAKRGIVVGQILLTYDDLQNRSRHLNAQSTITRLLEQKVIPIVNENDVVANDEIKVGDNDVLASLVTALIKADLLIMLSTTDGLQKMPAEKSSREKATIEKGTRKKTFGESSQITNTRIRELSAITESELALAFGKGSSLSTGGMASKLRAAQVAVRSGAFVAIGDGRKSDTISRILAGKDVGTAIGSFRPEGKVSRSRKQWLAFFNRIQGSVVVDPGAQVALEQKGKSLLPIGVKEVTGNFPAQALINVVGIDGKLIGRGLVDFSSDNLKIIRGQKSSSIKEILGRDTPNTVIHRDNFVVINNRLGEVA